MVDAPKVGKKILPSLSHEQVEYLIKQAECVRDKAIISLFADSGLRLSELANINLITSIGEIGSSRWCVRAIRRD